MDWANFFGINWKLWAIPISGGLAYLLGRLSCSENPDYSKSVCIVGGCVLFALISALLSCCYIFYGAYLLGRAVFRLIL